MTFSSFNSFFSVIDFSIYIYTVSFLFVFFINDSLFKITNFINFGNILFIILLFIIPLFEKLYIMSDKFLIRNHN